MKKIVYSIVACLVLLMASSCEKDEKAEIPSYLSIGEIVVTDTTGNIISSDAQDAWVYLGDQLKGVFELPTKLPILEEGPHEVYIRAGVNENGIYNLKVRYPFYQEYTEIVDFKDKETHHVDPVITYTDYTEVNTDWTGADFEGGINFNRSNNSDTFFVQMPNNTGNPVYGNTIGTFYLTDEKNFFEAYTDLIVDVPRNDPEVWVEMDYISDATITVGLYQVGMSNEEQKPLVYFKPQSNWTKVYVKLAAGILTNPNAVGYSLFIGCLKDNTYPTSVTSIDNVKLLHF